MSDGQYNFLVLQLDSLAVGDDVYDFLETLLQYIRSLENRLGAVALTIPPDYFKPIA